MDNPEGFDKQKIKKYLNIVPADNATLEKVSKYFEITQKHAPGRETLFVPAALGAITDSTGNICTFSSYGYLEQFKDINYVYDLYNAKTNFLNLATSQVLKCGVTTAQIGNYKLLTHGGGPASLATLTARGIQLIKQFSEITNPININLYYNKPKGYPSYSEGAYSYKSNLIYMAEEEGFEIQVTEESIEEYSYARV